MKKTTLLSLLCFLALSGFGQCISGDCFNGFGTFTSEEGTYKGDWKDGKIHGKGIFNGTEYTYDGEYLNGEKHGQGKMTYNNGKIQEGLFENGEFVKAKLHTANKEVNLKKTIQNIFKKTDNTINNQSSLKQGYEISGEIIGLKDTSVILAYYFGGKQYATDTTEITNGKLTFSGDKELEGGIYLMVLPGGKYFELIISEQKFSFTTDKNDLVASMNFKNSRENTAFYQYLNFISVQQQKVAPLKEKLSSAKEDEKKKIQKEINEVDNTVRDYREDFQSRYKDVFFSKIISATTDIVIPETPLDSTGKPKENFPFYYFKNHFWDNMDFSDKRMLRTPVFFNKMDKYLEKLSPKHPDSIIVSADIMIEKARANKEVFKYVVSYITSTYERSKIMGMDAVFVHMVEKYYMTAQCDWVKEKQLEKIIERAKRISPNMIGKKPPNLVFKDTSNQYHSLYHLQAKYTLLFFYDPDCGHCKKETPKVKAVCDSLVSAGIDIKVFAVNTEFDIKKWKEFIKKFDVGNWINVGDIQFDEEGNPVATSNWREQYDIHSTPVIYLLNKDKEIIAKRINDKQIVKIIKREESLEE